MWPLPVYFEEGVHFAPSFLLFVDCFPCVCLCVLFCSKLIFALIFYSDQPTVCCRLTVLLLLFFSWPASFTSLFIWILMDLSLYPTTFPFFWEWYFVFRKHHVHLPSSKDTDVIIMYFAMSLTLLSSVDMFAKSKIAGLDLWSRCLIDRIYTGFVL